MLSQGRICIKKLSVEIFRIQLSNGQGGIRRGSRHRNRLYWIYHALPYVRTGLSGLAVELIDTDGPGNRQVEIQLLF